MYKACSALNQQVWERVIHVPCSASIDVSFIIPPSVSFSEDAHECSEETTEFEQCMCLTLSLRRRWKPVRSHGASQRVVFVYFNFATPGRLFIINSIYSTCSMLVKNKKWLDLELAHLDTSFVNGCASSCMEITLAKLTAVSISSEMVKRVENGWRCRLFKVSVSLKV